MDSLQVFIDKIGLSPAGAQSLKEFLAHTDQGFDLSVPPDRGFYALTDEDLKRAGLNLRDRRLLMSHFHAQTGGTDRKELREIFVAELEPLNKKLEERGTDKVNYDDMPGYSKTIEKIGLTTPWEQYGLYGSTGLGLAIGLRKFRQAGYLAQAASSNDQSLRREMMFMARAAPHQLDEAAFFIRQFKAKGFLAATGFPLLWLAWRHVSSKANTKAKSRYMD